MKKQRLRCTGFVLTAIAAFILLETICLPIHAQSQPAASKAATRTLIDDAGRTVVLPATVRKAIVPNNWILSMVLAVGAKEMVVGSSIGVTRDSGFNAIYPEWTKKLVVVGDVSNLNKESVLKLEADVVLTQPGPNVAQMEAIGVPIVGLSRSRSAEDNVRLIGRSLGKDREAEALATYYSSKINLAKSRTADVSD